jgi:alkanesulfonate monooxygenase SsuD/methylene tetrahydromethanopterin reductase-like flavin-dependent oxidoreductase (luciferase family)
MDVGIGLPATIPGVDRRTLLGWARRAEERGFSSLGTIDRLVYPNLEPLLALGAAAAVTERIGLLTAILLGPLRLNSALLAKQLLTVDALSEGRLTVGIAVGGREDDYTAGGAGFSDRGRRFDAQLTEMREIFDGADKGFAGPIGPPPVRPGGPPFILGGSVDAAVRRTVEHGAGWIAGGSTPEAFHDFAEGVRAAWSEAGRDGAPRLMALGYFALGDGGEAHAQRYLGDYYGFLGEETAGYVASSALTAPDQAAGALEAFAQAGCDELVLFPCAADVAQVDLLADAAGL